jgi:hypothetical protein
MKTARRLEAKSRKPSTGGGGSSEDPDIAGIVPGPQRSPWADMGDFDPEVEAEAPEEPEEPGA